LRLDSEKIAGVKNKGHNTSTFEQAFGHTVLALRNKRGLSQMDLAVASGYSLRYIGDIERGAKSATMRTMHDLATLLDVRLSAVVAEAENLWESDSNARGRFPKPKR
jgi:transcriptional regulator with XRE-family HTH domain